MGFFLVGNGGDGKSTAVHVLHKLIGTKNVCSIPFSDLGKNFYTHKLTTHKLNLVEELNVSDVQGNIGEAEKIFKIATDGGMLPVEKKFQDIGEAPAKAKFVFCHDVWFQYGTTVIIFYFVCIVQLVDATRGVLQDKQLTSAKDLIQLCVNCF